MCVFHEYVTVVVVSWLHQVVLPEGMIVLNSDSR